MNDSPLIITLLPRGSTGGSSALLSLDSATLELTAYRPIGHEEFLTSRHTGLPSAVQHARGLVQSRGHLYVALFNGVREYAVKDARSLALSPRRLLTHPQAVDLHGLNAHGDRITAASTGADALIHWGPTGTQASATLLAASAPKDCDLRFPDRAALACGAPDWRDTLPGRRHINDVCVGAEGTLVCSLTQIELLRPSGRSTLASDLTAEFHDGQFLDAETAAVTDASRGALVLINVHSGALDHVRVADPTLWFVRGLWLTGQQALLLRSERVVSRQRDPSRIDKRQGRLGARFGLSIIDLERRVILAERDYLLEQAPAGAVVYKPLAWQLTAAGMDDLCRTLRTPDTALA